MINGTGVSSNLRVRLLVLLSGVLVVAAAQAQVQQPSYPAPNQTYPGQAPTYPAPNQGYPAPNQTYPSQSPVYPNPSYPTTPTYPNPAYPTAPPGYPNQGYPPNIQAYPSYPSPPQQSHFFRNLFAQTLAVVLQTTSGGLIAAIGGRIMEWFTRKGASPNPNGGQYAQYPNSAYPNAGYPNASYPNSAYPNPAYPSTATSVYPGTAYPTAAYPTATQTPGAYPGAPQTYPSQSSAYPTAMTAYPSTATPAYPSTAYPTAAYPTATQTPGAYPGAPQTYPSQATAYPTATTTYPSTATPAYPSTTYPSTASPAYPTATQTPGAYPGAPQTYASQPTAYPGTTYPQADAGAQTAYAAPSQVYDARTGQLVTGAANPYATRGLGMENAIYAGIAYEVQAIGADGNATPVNTATYEFHTGDKFMVYYRPSLPGHMEIYNINATGQQTLIDSSNMAAGQMTNLGPYQFTNQSGDETLRLVLSPCSSPQLLAATRDIVKMDSPPQASPTGGPLKLASCGAPAPRGVDVHTRDIEKVGVEGTTSFALDPISPKEMSSGQLTPREAIIVFHHR